MRELALIPTSVALGPPHTTHETLSLLKCSHRSGHGSATIGSSRADPLPLVEQGEVYARPSPWRVDPDAVTALIVLASQDELGSRLLA